MGRAPRHGCRPIAAERPPDESRQAKGRSLEGPERPVGPGATPAGLGESIERLAGVMARLRSPGGCPWDLEQTPGSLARHILEEAHESVDAIDSGDWEHLCEELGDLLLQIVFQARIAEEHGRFDLRGVVDGITEKLERRHPHIFGDAEVEDSEQVALNWDRIKAEQEGKDVGVSMPRGLPAMMAARKVQSRAARQGFDWEDPTGVIDKVEEETGELREALGGPEEELANEVGDLLFSAVNLARHLDVDPEHALRRATLEFVRRFSLAERAAASGGRSFEDMSLEEKEGLWQEVKRLEE